MPHPSENDLAVAAARRDPPAPADPVAAHLESGCEPCGRLAAFWRRIAATMAVADRDAAPPDRTRARAVALLPTPARPAPRPGPFRVFAELVLDTLRTPVPAPVRACSIAERHLLYSVRGFDIDMRIRGTSDGLLLVGQILPEGGGFVAPERLAARLAGPDGDETPLVLTEFGEFEARGLAPGRQTLELVLDRLVSYRLCFEL